jgi:hypothetical protein
MFRNLTKYQDKVEEVLKDMHEEVGSEEFVTADASHKKKMKTAINALQGIISYMSTKVVEREKDNELVYERNGTKI